MSSLPGIPVNATAEQVGLEPVTPGLNAQHCNASPPHTSAQTAVGSARVTPPNVSQCSSSQLEEGAQGAQGAREDGSHRSRSREVRRRGHTSGAEPAQRDDSRRSKRRSRSRVREEHRADRDHEARRSRRERRSGSRKPHKQDERVGQSGLYTHLGDPVAVPVGPGARPGPSYVIEGSPPPLPTDSPAPQPPASELEAVPLPAMASSVVSQVTEFVRGVLDPLYRAAMVTKEQYKVIVRKCVDKVMQHHKGAQSADFLLREHQAVMRLVVKTVEAVRQLEGRSGEGG
ncbi:hypothetical protein V8C86DRAFT_2491438 [Haematococcus lacustris]